MPDLLEAVFARPATRARDAIPMAVRRHADPLHFAYSPPSQGTSESTGQLNIICSRLPTHADLISVLLLAQQDNDPMLDFVLSLAPVGPPALVSGSLLLFAQQTCC